MVVDQEIEIANIEIPSSYVRDIESKPIIPNKKQHAMSSETMRIIKVIEEIRTSNKKQKNSVAQM